MRFRAWMCAAASIAAISCTVKKETFVPIGVNVGGALHPKPAEGGLVVGGEVSVARAEVHYLGPFPLFLGKWWGGYADVLHDLGNHRTRLSLGPEAGVAFFGADLGPILEVGPGGAKGGLGGRLLLTGGFVALYARTFGFFGAGNWGVHEEIGVLLKYPIPVQ